MSICESTHKMTPKEQEYFDLGYAKGKEDAVIHAHWVWFFSHYEEDEVGEVAIHYCKCSNCGSESDHTKLDTKYCPICGAIMDEEEE